MTQPDKISQQDIDRAMRLGAGPSIPASEVARLVREEVAKQTRAIEARAQQQVAAALSKRKETQPPGVKMALSTCKTLYAELASVYWAEKNKVLNRLNNWFYKLITCGPTPLGERTYLYYGYLFTHETDPESREFQADLVKYKVNKNLTWDNTGRSFDNESNNEKRDKCQMLVNRMKADVGRMGIAYDQLKALNEDVFFSFWPTFEAFLARDRFTAEFQANMQPNLVFVRNHLSFPHRQ
jgi:hypothetical protein